ncbi:unnamed protein product [Rhizophagus irregularis]|nr:unnamed protein product [Rhizophagus irregularis]
MFTNVNESFVSSCRSSLASILSIFSLTANSHKGSVTSLPDLTADELAFQECIEVIDANVEEVITNKADAREKKWWIDGNYKTIDENRLPLILIEGCYKFCHRNGVQNVYENYQPVHIIEFGTIDRRNQLYNGCTAPGMCIMNIFPGCIFRGCPQVPPYPINNMVIDFFPIQQAIFRAM